LSWLELTVYDVTGLIEPISDVGIEDQAALAVMNEDTSISTSRVSIDSGECECVS
jgi:hypothetical protein